MILTSGTHSVFFSWFVLLYQVTSSGLIKSLPVQNCLKQNWPLRGDICGKTLYQPLDIFFWVQSTLYIPIFDITTKLVIKTTWMERILSSRWNGLLEKLNNIVLNILRNIYRGNVLESPRRGDSNKCPQHVLLRESKERKGFLSLILLLSNDFGILYSGKFFLTAES